MACSGALAAYPLLLDTPYKALLGAAGATAVALLGVGIAGGWVVVFPWAFMLLLGEYLGALLGRGGGVDAGAPVYAAVLFASAELAYWSCDLGRVAAWERPATMKRLGAIASMTAAGALGAGLVATAASVASAGSGVAPVALGTVCAVTAVALLGWLAHRSAPQR